MTRDFAELISALSLTKIELLARLLHRHLRPRWEDQPTVWRHLLLAAQTDEILRAIPYVPRSQYLPAAENFRELLALAAAEILKMPGTCPSMCLASEKPDLHARPEEASCAAIPEPA